MGSFRSLRDNYSLSSVELERYSRNILIPEYGQAGQEKLVNSKVLCIGAGGLGSTVLLNLAAAGVGLIGVIDADVVELSNLQRQIVHGEADIGTLKVDSAKRKINELNSDVSVVTHPYALTGENALEIFSKYDVIVDCTDNFASRYLANDTCVLLKKPYVWGSIYRFDGQVSVFSTSHGPCYRCLHPTPPAPGAVPSCAEGGVLGVLCSTIGSLQATETIKVLTGLGEKLIGAILIYDALSMEFQKIALSKNPNCVLCGENPLQRELLKDYEDFCGIKTTTLSNSISRLEVTVSELRERIDSCSSQKDFVLIDVREESEFVISRIPSSILIPMGRFIDGTAFSDLNRESKIVLHCKSGIRSAECARILEVAGFPEVSYLAGGIDAWLNEG